MGLAWCEAGGSQLRPQGFASQPHSLSSLRQRHFSRLALVGLEGLGLIHDVVVGVRLGTSDSYRAESEVRPGFVTPRKPRRTRQTRRVESDTARGWLSGLGRVVWPPRRYTIGSGPVALRAGFGSCRRW